MICARVRKGLRVLEWAAAIRVRDILGCLARRGPEERRDDDVGRYSCCGQTQTPSLRFHGEEKAQKTLVDVGCIIRFQKPWRTCCTLPSLL